jgi:hypothetical protein
VADHPIEFVNMGQDGPFICATCQGFLCLDEYPERTDGDWIHVSDWKAKQEALKPKTLAQEIQEVLNDQSLQLDWDYDGNLYIQHKAIKEVLDKHNG